MKREKHARESSIKERSVTYYHATKLYKDDRMSEAKTIGLEVHYGFHELTPTHYPPQLLCKNRYSPPINLLDGINEESIFVGFGELEILLLARLSHLFPSILFNTLSIENSLLVSELVTSLSDD